MREVAIPLITISCWPYNITGAEVVNEILVIVPVYIEATIVAPIVLDPVSLSAKFDVVESIVDVLGLRESFLQDVTKVVVNREIRIVMMPDRCFSTEIRFGLYSEKYDIYCQLLSYRYQRY